MFRQDRCHPWVGQVFVDRHDASFGKPVGLGREDLPDARPNQHDSVHLIPTNTEWGKGGVGRGEPLGGGFKPCGEEEAAIDQNRDPHRQRRDPRRRLPNAIRRQQQRSKDQKAHCRSLPERPPRPAGDLVLRRRQAGGDRGHEPRRVADSPDSP